MIIRYADAEGKIALMNFDHVSIIAVIPTANSGEGVALVAAIGLIDHTLYIGSRRKCEQKQERILTAFLRDNRVVDLTKDE